MCKFLIILKENKKKRFHQNCLIQESNWKFVFIIINNL